MMTHRSPGRRGMAAEQHPVPADVPEALRRDKRFRGLLYVCDKAYAILNRTPDGEVVKKAEARGRFAAAMAALERRWNDVMGQGERPAGTEQN